MKNAAFKSIDVIRACENKLDIKFRDGSEQNGWFKYKGKKISRITVPKGRKYLPPQTYKSMSRQLQLPINDFDDFLECTFGLDEYIKSLRDRGVIKE